MSNLFAGVMPCGIMYCDKSKEVSGDYKKIAFLPYDTLILEVFSPRSKLLPEIKEDIKQYKVGDLFKTSTCGQEFELGYKVK